LERTSFATNSTHLLRHREVSEYNLDLMQPKFSSPGQHNMQPLQYSRLFIMIITALVWIL
ncbi:MAG TPA: hypothetical protein VK503_08365, partial [Candidatus Bathyarchaeia archaeon]|nr:hypothetical protein [Candidatus Bathyarchaeia archaeon]